MKKLMILAAATASLAALGTSPGLAQRAPMGPETVAVAPGVNPGPGAFRPVAGRRDAEHLANTVGLAQVDDADLDRGVWTVTGTDLNDKDMTVLVDARNGRIIQARYD